MAEPQNVSELYEHLYQQLGELKKETASFIEGKKELSLVEKERASRATFAIEAAEDILQNFVSAGKSLTINYDHASMTVKANHQDQN